MPYSNEPYDPNKEKPFKLTDKSFEQEYVPDPNRKSWNIEDIYNY